MNPNLIKISLLILLLVFLILASSDEPFDWLAKNLIFGDGINALDAIILMLVWKLIGLIFQDGRDFTIRDRRG